MTTISLPTFKDDELDELIVLLTSLFSVVIESAYRKNIKFSLKNNIYSIMRSYPKCVLISAATFDAFSRTCMAIFGTRSSLLISLTVILLSAVMVYPGSFEGGVGIVLSKPS